MPTKVDTYRQLADRATGNLTAQVADWARFLLVAGKFYKYNFLDQVMIYTQRPDATACAEFDLWTRRMNRHIRRGSRGIALLRYRDGRIFLRYVFDVADTERRANGRDPVLWQYKAGHESAVTARLEECFKVPGGDGLAKQLITLAVQFADEHWHDFGDRIMGSVHDSSLDGLDGDNVALRFRNAVTVSLAFLLLARCGFDLDGYFTPEDFACIGDFDTRDTVLALGNAVSESAGVILRQVEYAVKRQLRDPPKGPVSGNTAAGDEKPAAVPRLPPEEDMPAAPEITQAGKDPQNTLSDGRQNDFPQPPIEVLPEPEKFVQECFPLTEQASAPKPQAVPAAANFRITDDDPGGFGPKGRYILNVEAIQTLRNVEAEGRGATDVEQEMLARYTGWGAIPDAFDPGKPEWTEEYILRWKGKRLSVDTSNDAHNYFSQNDDGRGLERGALVGAILSLLEKRDKDHQNRWNKIWAAPICQQYRRPEHDDFWLWNHKFFNAPVEDLRQIAALIGAKV